MKYHSQLFAIFSIAIGGCAIFGGDLPFRVSGSVPPTQSMEAGEECELSLVLAKSGQVRSQREVSAQFRETFVVEARKKTYYFLLKCPGEHVFRSREISTAEIDSFNKIIELGPLTDTQQ